MPRCLTFKFAELKVEVDHFPIQINGRDTIQDDVALDSVALFKGRHPYITPMRKWLKVSPSSDGKKNNNKKKKRKSVFT